MSRTLFAAVPIVLLVACDTEDGAAELRRDNLNMNDDLTEIDARMAVVEVNEVVRPDGATAQIIDVSTDVTVGERVAATVQRWRAFWRSQAPCNTVTRDGNVVTVDFGTLDDECAIAGRTYAGIDTITLDPLMADDNDGAIHHDLDGFTNGVVSVDGTKSVYWTGDGMRRIAGDYTVMNLETGETRDISSQHTMGRLDPALPVVVGGFGLNGFRTWDGLNGEWNMDMNRLAFMVDDATAHAGNVVVTSPSGAELTIRYSRIDEDTTRAVVRGPRGNLFVFRVTAEGDVVPDDDADAE